MLHLGDITKISGYTAPIVDVVVGGSPCQDLSVAGKRAGLDGERSGLFMEQIRIVKEMRERDRLNNRTDESIRPRYMVWENVPGAFSSNKSEDFRIVLEEIAKVCDKDAVIPMPESGKWTTSGCIVGDGWSIAWRVCDAQFYGVPQRRRRIALVADFGGQSASEILFVSKGVSGNSQPSQPQRKETPSDSTRSFGADDCSGVSYTLKIRGGCEGGGKGALVQTEKSATLSTLQDQTLFQPVQVIGQGGKCGANYAVCSDSHGTPHAVCYSKSQRAHTDTDYETWKESDVANTLNAFDVGNNRTTEVVLMEAYQHHGYRESDVCGTLTANQNNGVRGDTPLVVKDTTGIVAYGIGSYHSNAWKSDNPNSGIYEAYTSKTLDITCGNPSCNQGGIAVVQNVSAVDCRNGTENDVVRVKYIVRRLTPLECERLQGYPDGWTDIGEWTDSKGKVRKTSDAARYKALGNSIALPPWKWVMKRLCACYERDATLASLFDGIGGFPLIWEQLNGKGSCLWASEIEEFPMAVTKARIGDD